jgi:plasmid stability protein
MYVKYVWPVRLHYTTPAEFVDALALRLDLRVQERGIGIQIAVCECRKRDDQHKSASCEWAVFPQLANLRSAQSAVAEDPVDYDIDTLMNAKNINITPWARFGADGIAAHYRLDPRAANAPARLRRKSRLMSTIVADRRAPTRVPRIFTIATREYATARKMVGDSTHYGRDGGEGTTRNWGIVAVRTTELAKEYARGAADNGINASENAHMRRRWATAIFAVPTGAGFWQTLQGWFLRLIDAVSGIGWRPEPLPTNRVPGLRNNAKNHRTQEVNAPIGFRPWPQVTSHVSIPSYCNILRNRIRPMSVARSAAAINDCIFNSHIAIIDSRGTQEMHMAQLVVRNLSEDLVKALKQRAAKHNRSAEQEHREILEAALRGPRRRSLASVLAAMPNVGKDEDFARQQSESRR